MEIDIFGVKSRITSLDGRGLSGKVGDKVNFDILFPLPVGETGCRNSYLRIYRQFAGGYYGKVRLNIPSALGAEISDSASHSIVINGCIDKIQACLHPGEAIYLSVKFRGEIVAKKKPLPFSGGQRTASWNDFAKDFEFVDSGDVAELLARTFMAGKKHDRQASKGK